MNFYKKINYKIYINLILIKNWYLYLSYLIINELQYRPRIRSIQ